MKFSQHQRLGGQWSALRNHLGIYSCDDRVTRAKPASSSLQAYCMLTLYAYTDSEREVVPIGVEIMTFISWKNGRACVKMV
jgi:hypothetical protein